MNEMTKEEMRDRLGNIDQIRDILFGSQLRESNSRFDQIDAEVSRRYQSLQDQINDVQKSLSLDLQTAVDSLEKKIRSINFSTQKETTELRQLTDRINKNLSSSIDNLSQNVEIQTNSLRTELLQSKEKSETDMRSLKSYILEELDKRLSLVKDAKVSKDDMAEILFEIGLRLRETEVLSEMQAVNDPHNSLDNRLLEPGQFHE